MKKGKKEGWKEERKEAELLMDRKSDCPDE